MAFRQALEAVPMLEREGWLDRELGIEDPLPADGGRLPADGVPYLPCSVANLLAAVDGAAIGVDDVVVDLGSGLGRACAFIHRWAGAETIGVEVQPQLVALAQAMSQGEQGMTWLQGEATQLVPTMTRATVFFLYCP